MELLKFLIWLTTGAVIGWFAKQMVTAEHRRSAKPKPAPAVDDDAEKS